jgi:[protein-PII] uridylyltransferase
VVRMAVEPRFGRAPDTERLEADLRQAALADVSAERLDRVASGRRIGKNPPMEPKVSWHSDVAEGSVVVEVRASDAPGLLYRIAKALAGAGADVRAARVATLGGDVVDAFYLVGDWSDPAERKRVATAVIEAAASA